jgi:hypothetical protein
LWILNPWDEVIRNEKRMDGCVLVSMPSTVRLHSKHKNVPYTHDAVYRSSPHFGHFFVCLNSVNTMRTSSIPGLTHKLRA